MTMSRTTLRLAIVATVLALAWMLVGEMTVGLSGQGAGQPSTKNGEWPAYTADIRGSRYSPLDQINASNFKKLEVAWRFKTDNLGTRPEFKLEGTPLMVKGVVYATAGTRRSVVALDGKTGELMWVHSLREGTRAAIAPRQLSGRGLSYWTDGRGDERVLYVTTGYRLVALNAKTGSTITSFGKDGIVDLKVGMVTGSGQQIDLETGEAGLHSTPTIVKDVVIVGSSFKEGMTVKTHNNTKGLVRAFDVRTGKLLWTFNTIPKPGEFGNDTWLNDSWKNNGNTGVWAQITVDEDLGLVYLPVESPTSDFYGGDRPGNNLFGESLVCVDLKTGQRKWHYPDRASPDLGLRPVVGAAARRHHGERPGHQGGRAAEQGSVPVRVRPRHRSAGVADRGASGAEGIRAGRVVFADAAVPDQAAGLRAPGGDGRRVDRFHAGDARAGDQEFPAVRHRTDVYCRPRWPRSVDRSAR